MAKINIAKVFTATILLFVICSYTISYLAEPPVVMDIDVCEGESTLIVPTTGEGGPAVPQQLAMENFDPPSTANIGYTASIMFNDGVNDHFGLTTGSNISNISGPYSFNDGTNLFWAAEDVNDDGGNGLTPQSVNLNPVTITNFTDIEFCIDVAAGNNNGPGSGAYDVADFINIEYSFDGGASLGNIICLRSANDGDAFNSSLNHDINCDGDGADGPQITTTAQQICYTFPASVTNGQNEIYFSVSVSVDAGNEEFAFDNILINGTPTLSGPISFNFYDVDPIIGMTTPILANAGSYDPMTTVITSPDTIWVTADDGQMESTAERVIITVNPNPNAEAGENVLICGNGIANISADAIDPTFTGTWSGGNGVFGDATSASTTYLPNANEIGTIIALTWTVDSENCGSAMDNTSVYPADEAGDAEFSYMMDTICPGDGILFPMHTTGVDGFYEVIMGNPDSLALDSSTGAIDIAASGMGQFTIQNTVSACGNMMITGVIDATLSGGIPKAIEFLVLEDIGDLSMYSFGSANNGGGTDGEEFIFPQMGASAGTYLYIASEPTSFEAWFGFTPDFITNAALINGDDAIELFCNGTVIDVFGDINASGTGQPWEYMDGWAYRNNNESINLAIFDAANWFYSGANALDNEISNATAAIPFPIGTFTTSFAGICPNNTFTQVLTIGDFEAPIIWCPNNITINADPGDCGYFAQLMDPAAFDNCSDTIIFVQLSGPVNGDYLDKENSPYTVVWQGTEMNGNVLTCSYTITVKEYITQTTTLACNQSINISLDESCGALITADMLLEGGTYGCYEDFGVVAMLNGQQIGAYIENDFGSGFSVFLDNTYINEPIEISIRDLDSGNSCWGYVILEDKLAPMFVNCGDVTVNCGDDTSPMPPDYIENCSIVTFDMDEEILEGLCTDTFQYQIIRTWDITDSEGNVGEPCVQTITVLKDNIEDLQLPENYDGLPGNFEVLACDGAGKTFAVNADGLPSPTPIGILPGTGVPTLGAGCSQLISTFVDTVLPVCGNSYKVVRNWTIIEWCTGTVVEYTQIIKVLDTVAPIFNAPTNITIAATPNCEGEYQLPLLPAIDNCGTASVSYSSLEGQIINGLFIAEPVELKKAYTIKATANDLCGNKNEKTFTVTFIDKTPPVVNAETKLTVSLSADGTAKLFAESFDDGSYDGCGDVGFSIIRMINSCKAQDYLPPVGDDNYQFNGVVHFCCSDVGTVQMVTFRVCDDADENGDFGNSSDNCNIAMVEVTVQDKLPPIILCPAPLTISCIDASGLDLNDSDLLDGLFGKAEIQYACEGDLAQAAVLSNACGAGVLIRTFTASNSFGQVQCSQVITVTSNFNNNLTCDRISFENINNFVYNWCKVNDNTNDSDDDLKALEIQCDGKFIAPKVNIDIDGLCTQAGINMEVDSFLFAGGACRKYLVHYEVIDQCVFDDNFVNPVTGEIDPYHSDNGYFEFYLEIDAFDKVKPVFSPQPAVFNSENCDSGSVYVPAFATDNCTSSEYLSYLYKIDYFSDNTIDFPVSGWAAGSEVATGLNDLLFVPVGEHTILWIVSDGCGNTITRSQKMTLLPNSKKPTPYCRTGYVASISAMGMFTVNAEEFDAGSFDNCDASEDLRFSFSSDVNDTERMYTCDDLGFQFITVYVTDLDGNQDYCSTSFLVQDNGDFCSNTITFGSISSNMGYKNANAKVIITDIEQNSGEMISNENGVFGLNTSMYSTDATLSIVDDNDLLLGVTTFDIIKIQKHILGLSIFETNAQLIAADVDNNDKITGADIIQIRKVILGKQEYFKNNKSWVAYPANFDLESLGDAYSFPEVLHISSSNALNFTSIKIADVNSSHSLTSNPDAETRSKYDLDYSIEKIDGLYQIKFFGVPTDLAGFNLVFENINENNFVSLESGLLNLSSDNYHLTNHLVLNWSDLGVIPSTEEPLFSIFVESISMDQLILNDIYSEAYIGKDIITEEYKIRLRNRSNPILESELNLNIYPNPSSDRFLVDMNSIPNIPLMMTLTDSQGKLVLSRSVSGQSTSIIENSDILHSGVYYLSIKGENIVFIKKLIKI